MKKILLLGDSIRLGYDKYVKMAFEDVAEVYYPQENCRFVMYILRHLSDWKAELGCGDDVDLIHWNAGLWDDLVMWDGKPLTPIEIYREYLDRTCQVMKLLFPKAKMIFATSTPVQEELFLYCKRYNKDTEAYNKVAAEVITRHGGVINDLYTLAKEAPVEYHSDLTHYYTKEGTRLLAGQVIKCLEEALALQAKELDYDALFADTENIVGM